VVVGSVVVVASVVVVVVASVVVVVDVPSDEPLQAATVTASATSAICLFIGNSLSGRERHGGRAGSGSTVASSMEIILVRHGEPAWTPGNKVENNPELTVSRRPSGRGARPKGVG
jgi:hypothetical protein